MRGSYRERGAYKGKIYLLLNMIILFLTLLWCYRQITALKGPKKTSGLSGPEQNSGFPAAGACLHAIPGMSVVADLFADPCSHFRG